MNSISMYFNAFQRRHVVSNVGMKSTEERDELKVATYIISEAARHSYGESENCCRAKVSALLHLDPSQSLWINRFGIRKLSSLVVNIQASVCNHLAVEAYYCSRTAVQLYNRS